MHVQGCHQGARGRVWQSTGAVHLSQNPDACVWHGRRHLPEPVRDGLQVTLHLDKPRLFIAAVAAVCFPHLKQLFVPEG